MEESTLHTETVELDSNFTDCFTQDVLPAGTDLVIGGSDEQRAKMFVSFAEYFSEVQNPENTTINTFFKAKYAPLNEVLNTIRPVMGKYGLSITQATGTDNGECFVSTLVMHSSGGYIYYPALKGKPTKTDIQGIGAVLTYLRRFALNAVSGVAGEVDDDGNSVSTPKQQEKPKPPERREIDNIFDKIAVQIKTLTDNGIEKKIITETVENNCLVDGKNTANYRKLKDMDGANMVLTALNKIGGNK